MAKLKNVLGFFLNIFLFMLSYFIPKNKKQFLLGAEQSFVGNPKFFFLYLCKYKKKSCNAYWISINKKTFSLLQKKNMPVVYLWSWKGFVTILRSNFLIFSHGINSVTYSRFLPGKFNKINTWHGSAGIKKWQFPNYTSKSRIVRLYNKLLTTFEKNSCLLFLTCSQKWKSKKESYLPKAKFRILGYPRNDIFFKKIEPFENYCEKFNLNLFERVILYCPTFRDVYVSKKPFSENFLSLLNSYLKTKNYLFLIKRHPYKKAEMDYPEYSNIMDISKKIDDVQELLIHTDILITDYSSVCADFCLTGKPIIFYHYDFEEYSKIRGFDLDYFNEVPGPFAKNEDELFETIKKIDTISNSANYEKRYLEFQNSNHLFQDGNSSERLYSFLISGI